MQYREGMEGVRDHVYDLMLHALKTVRRGFYRTGHPELAEALDDTIQCAEDYRFRPDTFTG